MHFSPQPVRPAAPLSTARRDALLEAMRGRTIVVLGDAMLDRYLEGDSDRLSPEAPVPVVTVSARREALGGAANVAANVAALGSTARLVAVIGRDADADRLGAALSAAGLAGDGLLMVPDRPTTVKTRVIARGQQILRIDEETEREIEASVESALVDALHQALASADALVLEDYNKGVLTPAVIRAAIAAGRARGIPVVVDPKFRHFFEYRGATILKPNRRELAAALGAGSDPTDPAALTRLLTQLDVGHLLLTLGADGMLLVAGDGGAVSVPGLARAVFDVSGAGDTVTAWVATALAGGATVAEAAQLANLAAGVEVGKRGVAVVRPEEVRELPAG